MSNPPIAIFIPSLKGGGAERVAVILAGEFVKRGLAVDLLAARAEGEYLAQVPPGIRVIDFKAKRAAFCLLGLIRYLRSIRPAVLLSFLDHANVIALVAKRLSMTSTRTVVSVRSVVSASSRQAATLRERLMPFLIRSTYRWADRVVAISKGVAIDLGKEIGVGERSVTVIYNPARIEEIEKLAGEPSGHPWLDNAEFPVVLAAGRLIAVKDFTTLIYAIAELVTHRPGKLVILGEGEDRIQLENLIRELNLERYVSLPGFQQNPFSFMSRASVFVLSSVYEGLGNVLIEALACGCPVVSTDCPGGPAEILDGGRYGPLVPVGNPHALCMAVIDVLDHPIPAKTLRNRAQMFDAHTIATRYLEELLPDGRFSNSSSPPSSTRT